MFNERGYLEKLHAGELNEVMLKNNHPSRPLAKEPYCTRSQYIRYVDARSGAPVAEVHQYYRRDGSIGASGRPEPKVIFEHEVGIAWVINVDAYLESNG